MPGQTPKTAVLIVAAGRGHRMGDEVPKQYLSISGTPVLTRTLHAFLPLPDIQAVQVVIHPDDAALYKTAVIGMTDPRLLPPVSGGATRAASVHAGLTALAGSAPDKVLIHDAARPFVSAQTISRVRAALATSDGAFAAVPVVDALWAETDAQMAERPVPRQGLWRAQTPQGFGFKKIYAAHGSSRTDAADDVEIARAAGLSVQIVEGEEDNFKITTPQDLARAERLLATIG